MIIPEIGLQGLHQEMTLKRHETSQVSRHQDPFERQSIKVSEIKNACEMCPRFPPDLGILHTQVLRGRF